MSKQTEIAGTEKVKIATLEEAAEDYREARDARMRAAEVEAEKKSALILEVRRQEQAGKLRKVTADDGLTDVYYYEDGGEAWRVRHEIKEDVKVNKAKRKKDD